MPSPEDPERESPSEGVDLTKGADAGAEAPFDPYRFGKPDHPIPAEYAPPGYTGPVVPTVHTPPPPGWGAPPPAANPANPFSNPPGTPYSPYGDQPTGYSSPPPPGQQPYAPPGQPPPGPPGQYPYGPPGQTPYAPPGYDPYAPAGYGYARRAGTGKAVTALVLGIASIFFCWLFFLDAALVIPGLIFGLIALSEAKRPGGAGRGLALTGLICSVAGGVLATVATVLLVHAANQCGGLNNGNAPGFNQCVKDHFF
jgi:Domain of unknown function (DUF4190)